MVTQDSSVSTLLVVYELRNKIICFITYKFEIIDEESQLAETQTTPRCLLTTPKVSTEVILLNGTDYTQGKNWENVRVCAPTHARITHIWSAMR